MNEYSGHKIKSVEKDSIAQELGIEPGDILLEIDGEPVEDVLDYRMKISAEHMVMLVLKPDGEEWEYDIENDYEDPGLEFESPLMSEYRNCRNKCIFCFIDQMPPGMRETLYFKDDDSRLSFLQGNYVTLTNMSDHDVQRIIDYRMEPINISIHTTNPELRCRMMNNRFAGDSLKYLDRLFDAGIVMNGQIVLCPGWNDGAELERTLSDLIKYAGCMESVSVVPVGLTAYRDKLQKLLPVDKDKAVETIEIINRFRSLAEKAGHGHFVHASDELYLLAGLDIPEESEYDGYLQLENGVGMLRLLYEEFKDAEDTAKSENCSDRNNASTRNGFKTNGDEFRCETAGHDRITLVTGCLAEGFLKKLLADYPWINVKAVRNEFFGERITVSGLVTGTDVIKQLKGTDLGTRVIMPVNMFRSGEEVMLDDVSRSMLEEELGVPVEITGASGYELFDAVNGSKKHQQG